MVPWPLISYALAPALPAAQNNKVMMTFLMYVYLSVLLIVTLIGAVRLPRLTTAIRILTAVIFITLVSESLSTYLPYRHVSNTIIYHFYVIVSFWLYSLTYFFLFIQARQRLIILVVLILYTLFALVDSLFYQKLQEFPSLNIIVYNVLLFVYSILYMKNLIDLNPFEPSYKNPTFLFNIAVLSYFTIQIFIWGILNYLLKTGKDIDPLVLFSMCTGILFYGTLGIAILQGRKIPPA
jgi:hypothetical protein